MKVLFLDIDGVLNSNSRNEMHQMEISDKVLIDEKKVNLLLQIINSTNAKMVLHSGWKYWFDNHMKPLKHEAVELITIFNKYGLKIYDKTPDLATDDIKRSKKFSLVKASEILSWLEEHKDVTSYVVLDDLDLHNDIISHNQVKTDSKMGLSEENVIQAIDKLFMRR